MVRRKPCSTSRCANGAPVALRDLGMKADDLDRACDIALQNQYANPRPLERAGIRALLQDAFEGSRPAAAQAHAAVRP